MSGAIRQMYNPMQSIGIYEKTNRDTSTGNALQEMMNPQTAPEQRRQVPGQIAGIAPDEALELQKLSQQMDDRQRAETEQQYGTLASMIQGIDDEETWGEALRMVNGEFAKQGKPPLNVPFSQREGLIARVLGMKEYFAAKDKAADNVRQDALTQSQITQNYAQARKYNADADGGGGSTFSTPTATPGGGADPFAPVDIYQGLDDVGRRQIYSKQVGDYQTVNAKMREDVQNMMALKAKVGEFVGLNAEAKEDGGLTPFSGDTGGLMGGNYIYDTARGAIDPRYGRMMSLTDEIAPLMRQGLPGAASDRDVAMFRGATVGTGKRLDTNVHILKGVIRAAENLQAQQQFFDWYFQRYRSTVGADNAWLRYNEENPIFANDDPTKPVLNENRTPWRQWVQSKLGGPPQGGQPQGGQPQPQRTQNFQPPQQQWQKGAPAGVYVAPEIFRRQHGPLVKFVRSDGKGNLELLGEGGQELEPDDGQQ